eukprot:scaffold9874_cov51-Cyclotella_meneghiniana.AAC.9
MAVILPYGGEPWARPIIRPLISSLSGDCAADGSCIDAANADAHRGDIREGVGGVGVVWAAIWRLPVMVEVVDVSIVGLKMARKEALSQQKRNSAPMPFRTTTKESVVLGLRSRLDSILKALNLGFPTLYSFDLSPSRKDHNWKAVKHYAPQDCASYKCIFGVPIVPKCPNAKSHKYFDNCAEDLFHDVRFKRFSRLDILYSIAFLFYMAQARFNHFAEDSDKMRSDQRLHHPRSNGTWPMLGNEATVDESCVHADEDLRMYNKSGIRAYSPIIADLMGVKCEDIEEKLKSCTVAQLHRDLPDAMVVT